MVNVWGTLHVFIQGDTDVTHTRKHTRTHKHTRTNTQSKIVLEWFDRNILRSRKDFWRQRIKKSKASTKKRNTETDQKLTRQCTCTQPGKNPLTYTHTHTHTHTHTTTRSYIPSVLSDFKCSDVKKYLSVTFHWGWKDTNRQLFFFSSFFFFFFSVHSLVNMW